MRGGPIIRSHTAASAPLNVFFVYSLFACDLDHGEVHNARFPSAGGTCKLPFAGLALHNV